MRESSGKRENFNVMERKRYQVMNKVKQTLIVAIASNSF